MHTIKLKVSNNVYEKFKSIISKFEPTDIEIIKEYDNYYEAKKYVEHELQEMKEGKAEYYTLEEFEEILDRIIDEN